MAYDVATAQLVLFGGQNAGGYLADTWTLSYPTSPTSSWTSLQPAAAPSARSGAAMAYDPGTGQLVLFGGVTSAGSVLRDTWTWNGTDWTQLHPGTIPPARSGATLAYDPDAAALVLYGGASGTTRLDDTWTWNGTTWARQLPALQAPARSGAVMAYDPNTAQLVLFGGTSATGALLRDTWVYGSRPAAAAVAVAPGVPAAQTASAPGRVYSVDASSAAGACTVSATGAVTITGPGKCAIDVTG
jgi:hypothetical protein